MQSTNTFRSSNIQLLYSIIEIVILILTGASQIKAATWSTKTVDTPVRNGGCTGTYTITLKAPNSGFGGNSMSNGAAVTITFNSSTGIDATTCTGGTHNGTAIGTITTTATTISYSAPVAVAENVSFTIVLNGITHGSSIAAGNITVDIVSNTGTNTGTTGNYATNAFPGTVSAAGTDQSVCTNTATFAGNSPAAGETGAWSLISGSGTVTTPTSATSGVTGLGSLANTFRWTITITASGCKSMDDVIITNNGDLSSILAYTGTNCPASTTTTELSLSSSTGTIQWQQNDNGAGFANIVGATTTPYIATKTAGHTYSYRANITTACGTYTIDASSTVTNYSMKDYSGGTPAYATANAAGSCYTNLTAGQKYCFSFIYSRYIEIDWLTNGCASCPTYGYVKLFSTGGSGSSSSGGCTLVTSAGNSGTDCGTSDYVGCGGCEPSMYDNACTLVRSNGFQFGNGCGGTAMTSGNVYYICFTVPAGCGGMNICPQIKCQSGNCAASPLPIELLYFNVEKIVGGQVQLKWATATEINNDYFTVERSSDAQNFALLEKVNGAGNSNSTLNYKTFDEDPLNGISYYRLKQTDYDGNYSFSRMVSVQTASDNPLSLMYVFVDQSNNSVQYQFSYTQNNPLVVEILDVVGKKILSQKVSSNDNVQVLNLDASALSKGMYILKISDGIYSQMKKFIY